MPRPPRLLLSHSYYHIITRGNNRHQTFKDPADYQYFLDKLALYKKELPFDLFHYCLMPNHVHLLVRTKNAAAFSLFMKKLNLSYFHYFRRRYGWVGHFWQDRFKSQPVGKDSYFIQCGKYIELNPVRAGLTEKAEGYPFSSYSYYRLGQNNTLLTKDMFYNELGQTVEKRRTAYDKLIVNGLVEQSYKKTSWGSEPQRYNENKKTRNHLKTTN